MTVNSARISALICAYLVLRSLCVNAPQVTQEDLVQTVDHVSTVKQWFISVLKITVIGS